MVMTDNISRGEFERFVSEVRRWMNASPLANATISRGALRVVSAEGLIVEGSARVSGILVVTGTETVEGELRVTGSLVVSGDLGITGPTVMSGTFRIDGATTINGKTVVNGDLDLNGSMVVGPGGKITVGNMVIDPTISGGAIVFANSAQVFTDGSTIQMYRGNGVVQISNTDAVLQFGGHAVVVSASGVWMNLPVRSRDLANNAVVGTVWSDSSGNLFRVVL